MKVVVLHAYSADNLGDGLLVGETLSLLREVFDRPLDVTLVASWPESFASLPVTRVRALPGWRGYDPEFLKVLTKLNDFDLIVGVGGGYLRLGTPLEAVKTILVQGPQLLGAALSTAPSVYLPQSIGPARFGTSRLLKKGLGHLSTVIFRDDRSAAEFRAPNAVRMPDLAVAAVPAGRQECVSVSSTPVLSVRNVRGRLSDRILELANLLSEYDVYVQSTVGGNDDRMASAKLAGRNQVTQHEIVGDLGSRRVIVAVRMHAALMAMAAGHYVIHLAYERKGFGAFEDLNVAPWVHNHSTFLPHRVKEQVDQLVQSPKVRRDYDERLSAAASPIWENRARLKEILRGAVVSR